MKALVAVLGMLLSASLWRAEADDCWITVAESLTSQHGPALVQYRMFSTPDFAELCSRPQPYRLQGLTELLTLYVGEPFALETVQVIAQDREGRRLEKTPLMIDVEEGKPALFDRVAVQNNPNVLTPLREGGFQFRVRSLCGASPLELYLKARVITR